VANPTAGWDKIPVFGVYQHVADSSPVSGSITFSVSQRITKTDGRIIYPDGATVTVNIGVSGEQDATIKATVHDAWKAVDALLSGYDSVTWEAWWTDTILPAAIFTSFPASDDPDIVQQGYQVLVKETLSGGGGKTYAIQPLLVQLSLPIPGINLGAVLVPDSTPTILPVYAKDIPGGVAGLDSSGHVPKAELPQDVVYSNTVDVLWTGTQAAYDAIVTKDPNTLYVITA